MIDRRDISNTEWDEARERLKAEVEGCPPSFETLMDDVVIWLFWRIEDLTRKLDAENAINRKLDVLKRAVVMLVDASPFGLLDDDAVNISEDLDEVWDEG